MSKLDELENTNSEYEKNQLLFSWLRDEDARTELFAEMRSAKPIIKFTSRAPRRVNGKTRNKQAVYLLSRRKDILKALKHFSNAPYGALGTGTFMLGLDGPDPEHVRQRQYMARQFRYSEAELTAAAERAWQAASVLPLKRPSFDLVKDIAEQAALRFTIMLFGFEDKDLPVLSKTMALAYRGMSYQMFARHFVTEPGTVPKAMQGMGGLMQRIAEIIDAGAPHSNPVIAEPVLKRLASNPEDFSGRELAVMAVGSIAGIIGNFEASISLAVAGMFKAHQTPAGGSVDVLTLAQNAVGNGNQRKLTKIIIETLRLNPPAPFLPRVADGKHLKYTTDKGVKKIIPKGAVVILPIGSACRDVEDGERFDHRRDNTDTMIFGQPKHGDHSHRCLGDFLTIPVVTNIISNILRIPGLDEAKAGQVIKRRWGFNCSKFPMVCEAAQRQQPLNVVMNVKAPVAKNAEYLKKVIAIGAPRIEKSLNDSNIVHFARFIFLDGDSRLALLTTFDGDFEEYLRWFVDNVGDLFDDLFKHIEDGPRAPVRENPDDFVATIRRYHIQPAGGYFYSAYPQLEVGDINGAQR